MGVIITIVGLYIFFSSKLNGFPLFRFCVKVKDMDKTISSVHDRWLNTITLVLGYLWLVSGLDKILSGEFVSGFADYVSLQIAEAPIVPWYNSFLSSFVMPNSVLAANSIQYAEFFIGAILVLASIWNFISHSRFAHYALAWASVISFVFVLNIILASGASFPIVDAEEVFEEGVNLDFVVLFLSFFLALSNFSEARLEKIKNL